MGRKVELGDAVFVALSLGAKLFRRVYPTWVLPGIAELSWDKVEHDSFVKIRPIGGGPWTDYELFREDRLRSRGHWRQADSPDCVRWNSG